MKLAHTLRRKNSLHLRHNNKQECEKCFKGNRK